MDGVRRMKGLVLEERKARQVSTKSKVMSMSKLRGEGWGACERC